MKTIQPLNDVAIPDSPLDAPAESAKALIDAPVQSTLPSEASQPKPLHQAAERPTADTPSPLLHEPAGQKPVKEGMKPVWKLLRGYVIGLVLSLLVGFGLGLILGDNLFASQAVKFASFEDTARVFLFIIPLTIVFFFIGAVVGNKWVALYPIVAFGVASAYAVPSGILFYLPAPLNEAAIQAGLAYMIAHSLVWSSSRLLQYSMRHDQPSRIPLIITASALFLVVTPIIGTSSLVTATAVAHTAVRTMATVATVNTDAMYSAFGVKAKATDTPNLDLYYATPILTGEGMLQVSNDISVGVLNKVWLKDSLEGCKIKGDAKTTKTGHRYIESSQKYYASKPEAESAKYTRYKYCFSVNYTTFTLERTDALGLAINTTYPIDDIITAFHEGDTVNVLCVSSVSKKQLTSDTSICTDDERAAWDAMLAVQYTRGLAIKTVTGTPVPLYVPADAYAQTSWLPIPELGIELPLNEDMRGMIYRGTPYGYELLLPSVQQPRCLNSSLSFLDEPYVFGTVVEVTPTQISQMVAGKSDGAYIGAVKPMVDGRAFDAHKAVLLCGIQDADVAATKATIAKYNDMLVWSTANARKLAQQ